MYRVENGFSRVYSSLTSRVSGAVRGLGKVGAGFV